MRGRSRERWPGARIIACWAGFTAALGCSAYDNKLVDEPKATSPGVMAGEDSGTGEPPQTPEPDGGTSTAAPDAGSPAMDAAVDSGAVDSGPPPSVSTFDPLTCSGGDCWWSHDTAEGCRSAGAPSVEDRPPEEAGSTDDIGALYLGWTRIRLGAFQPDGSSDLDAWQGFGLDLDGICTNGSDCPAVQGMVACTSPTQQIPFDGLSCRDNTFARLQPVAAMVPEIGQNFGIAEDVFNCELWHGSYNIVTRITGYNGQPDDPHVRVDFYLSDGLEKESGWSCPLPDFANTYPLWRTSSTWHIDEASLTAPIETPGTLPDAVAADPDAYVRSGYLVARPPDNTMLRLIGHAMPYRGFPLRVYGGYWLGHLQKAQDGTWTMRDGLSAGRIRQEDLIQSFREVGFCPGGDLDVFYEAMETYVHENADVLADGSVDPAAPCDAMSFGIAFEASQLTPGTAGPVEPLIECCPPGVSAEQCMTVCGDGVVTGDERCDTAITGAASGACPTSCAPLDACTPTALAGEGCAARCEPQPVTALVDGDRCCPPNANETDDKDCEPKCGNGVIETGETCDPASSCATTCSSNDACLAAVATGAADSCNFKCSLQPVTACKNADGCCPEGCTQANDNDCSASCGDGVIDASAGETCEAGSATPCPQSCDDGKACTSNVRTGSASNCNVRCTYPAITQPLDGDGCCPPGANANTDNNCTPVCGNGAVESGERCDGNCPTSCNDNKVCTTDTVAGSGCARRCNFAAITAPANGDGCCPPGANANNDDSCTPVCGNRVVEPGEGCDDGNTTAGDGCNGCQIETSEQMCLGILGKSDACATCSCQKCQSVTVSCFASSDAAKNARCKALVDCGRAQGCSGTDCYCGTVDLFGCLFGLGNGKCRAEVEAAAEATSPVDIQARADDTFYALGRANAVAECGLASCASPCNL